MIHAKYVGKIEVNLTIPSSEGTVEEARETFEDYLSGAIEAWVEMELDGFAKVSVNKELVEVCEKSS